jgi:Sec-independent protein translocase protein TatA
VETLRTRYASKVTALQDKVRRAEQAVAREQAQATQATMDTALSLGGALLGALLGRGKLSGTVGRVGTAARGAGRAAQQRGDVARAQETLEELRAQETALADTVRQEAEVLAARYEAQREEVEAVAVRAKAADVQLVLVALAWVPEPG